MQSFISRPHAGKIYILEIRRRGSSKIVASAMPEAAGLDVPVTLRRVPLSIRREARAAFATGARLTRA